MKTKVLEALGEAALQRPAAVNEALAANDQVKYLLSLLQMAIAHADTPQQASDALRHERLAAGIADASLDATVPGSQREGALYRLPAAAKILGRIRDTMQTMAAPVIDAGAPGMADRLRERLGALPAAKDDVVDGAAILAMTRAGQPGADTLHQLVMDLHKRLNALQADLAEERLDGAAVYALAAEDRPRVAAFMAGLNRTAPLKFDHPGLGTTATRAGTRLTIQNDIGTTDAHVIVIHVENRTVEVTYSDVHPERAQFFRTMLDRFPVTWGKEHSRREAALAEGGSFVLSTGRFEATDETDLMAYLTHLGSRLVFLIDWNRARKQVRGFLRKADRVALLAWAAENEIGHRGFLELGGARLVNDAIEVSAGTAMHFGDRLCDALGDEAAIDFLRFAFRAASEGLRARQSQALIRDRVQSDLAARFSNEVRRLLHVTLDHAGLIFEIACLVREGVHSSAATPAANAALAGRARAFEHDADQVVAAMREIVRRRPDHRPMLRLLEAADDAADHLEEAASLLELLARSNPTGSPLEALGALADLLVDAAQEWVKTIAHAAHLGRANGSPAGTRDDVGDFLTAVDRIAALEHEADNAERALTYTAVQQAVDFRQLHLYAKMGEGLEAAADDLKLASLIAHDHVLGQDLRG